MGVVVVVAVVVVVVVLVVASLVQKRLVRASARLVSLRLRLVALMF